MSNRQEESLFSSIIFPSFENHSYSKTAKHTMGNYSIQNDASQLSDSSSKASKATTTVEISARTGKPKRRKAVRACTNCQRTHLTCDDNRPCERCVKRGCADTCFDGVRKKPHKSGAKHSSSHTHHISMAPDRSSFFPTEEPWGLGLVSRTQNTQLPTSHGHVPTFHRPYSRDRESVDNEESEVTNFSLESPHVPLIGSFSPHLGPSYRNHDPDSQISIQSIPVHQKIHQPQPFRAVQGSSSSATNDYEISRPSNVSLTNFDLTEQFDQNPILHPSPSPNERLEMNPSLPITNVNDNSGIYSYDVVSDYFDPLDSYHLPLQSSFHRYSSGSQLVPEYEPESVISNMLRNRSSSLMSVRANPPSFKTTSLQEHSPTTNMSAISNAAMNSRSVSPTKSSIMNAPNSALSDNISLNSASSSHPNANILSATNVDKSDKGSTNNGYFIDSSEVYRRVAEPFPYLQSFQLLKELLQRKLNPAEMKNVNVCLEKIVGACLTMSRPLSTEDKVLIEQCFQRSLLEENKKFALVASASLVWRRSGNIAAVSPRFVKLTQRSPEELESQFLTSIMDSHSIMEYFEKFVSHLSIGSSNEFRFNCTLISHSGKRIQTDVEVTINRDLFNMPLTILGRFCEKRA